MQKTFSSPAVVCRPALASDAADILEFTKFIWEGHDYIKYVWDEWLADPEGLLMVAEYAGHAVGLGKLTHVSPGQWWLEGLRVDPQHQGLKIGSHIFEYLDDWWKQKAGGTVRLMTSSERVQVHHLSERLGYDKLGEVSAYGADAKPEAGQGDGFEAVNPEDVKQAAQFAAPRLADYNGLMDSGWQFSEPDEAALREKAEQGRLWWWALPPAPPQIRSVNLGRGDQHTGLLSTWEDQDEGGRSLGIGFAAVEQETLPAMLDDTRRLAHRLGYSQVHWLAPVIPWVEAVLKEAGFVRDWDGSAFLYGKRAKGGDF